MLDSPKNEINKITECKKYTDELRGRFENDYEYFYNKEYTVSKEEGMLPYGVT